MHLNIVQNPDFFCVCMCASQMLHSPLFIKIAIVLEPRAKETRCLRVTVAFYLAAEYFFLKVANYNRRSLVLNVKHYVILIFSSRWKEWVTSTGLKAERLFKLELAKALIEWGCLKVCVRACVCLRNEDVISHHPVCVAFLVSRLFCCKHC